MITVTQEELEVVVRRNKSISGVMRDLGYKILLGGSHTNLAKRIKNLGIDTSHFLGQGHNKGKVSNRRSAAADILILRTSGHKEKTCRLRRALLEVGVPHVCNCCGVGCVWQGNELILEINHISGNPLDNRRENLEFICPNCHSQTPTYGTKNKKITTPA